MASEPDDYQTISDNCPGYMVLVSEGIICTRCAGEKRHRANDCPKYATAADLATDSGSGADPDGLDNVDSGMESLSDTSSISSESTGRSDGSEMQEETDAHRTGQGGNHPQDAHLSRRGFARPDASYTSTQPDRTSPSPLNHQSGRGPTQSRNNSQICRTATSEHETQSRHRRDIVYGPKQSVSAKAYSILRSSSAIPRRLSSSQEDSSMKNSKDRKRKGSHSHGSSSQQTTTYEPNEDRLPSQSLADTLRKLEYSDTTCPSSFGFGRLPSEAMG